MDDIDFFDEQPQAADLKEVLKLARTLVEKEVEYKSAEAALKLLSGKLHELKTKTLPEAMATAGMPKGELKLEDGTKVKVEDFVSGSLPKDPAKREIALKELIAIGGEGLIKNELSLTFEKREHNIATDLKERLVAEGYEPVLEANVHPQSLMALVRERLQGGGTVDPEKLGCFVGQKAKVTLPRSKKKGGDEDEDL